MMSSQYSAVPMLAPAENRMTRRRFCQHALALSIVGSGMGLSLGACEDTSPLTSENINWYSETDQHDSFAKLVDKFNELHPGITVKRIPMPEYSDSKKLRYQIILDHLHTGNPCFPDVVSLDVVWMRKFVSEGLLEQLDKYWHTQDQYLPKPLDIVKIDGKVWAAPLHTDVGVLFYRTDLKDVLSGDPMKWTWEDIKSMALKARGQVSYGYLWQGQSEGLVCNFIEVLSSFGGCIFANDDPHKVVVNSPEGIAALKQMVDWIHGRDAISPLDAIGNEETDSTKWVIGNAAFMRNWPSHVFWSEDARDSKIAGNFAVTHLPSGIFGAKHYPAKPCLGGWQMAITKDSQHKDAAWKFIEWMIDRDPQRYLAVREAFPFTLRKLYCDTPQNLYCDKYIDRLNPFLKEVPSILLSAQSRPMLPYYQSVSNSIQQHIHQAFEKPEQYPPEKALQDLQHDLERIVAENSKATSHTSTY